MKISIIIDSIHAINNHLRLSYREIVVTSIGLIISLSIISASIILLDTQQANIITDSFNYHGLNTYSISSVYNTQNYYQYLNDWALTINNFNLQYNFSANAIIQSVNESLSTHNLLNKVSEIKYNYISRNAFSLFNASINTPVLNNLYITEVSNLSYLKPYLETGSTLVESNNNNPAAILVAISDSNASKALLPNIGSVYQLKSVVTSIVGTLGYFPLDNISITGRAIITTNTFYNFLNEGNYLPFYATKYVLLVQNLTKLLYTLSDKVKSSGQNFNTEYNFLDVGYTFQVYYNFFTSNLDSFDPNVILTMFQTFDLDIGTKLYLNGLGFYTLQDNLYNHIKSIQSDITSMKTFDVIFNVPIIIVAIFLVYYSFSLVHNQQYLQLRVYLTRGISKIQYLVNLFSEILISFIFSFIGGFLLSLPLSALIVNTSNYLEFNNINTPVISIGDIFPILLIIDILLVVIINILRIYKLSSLTIGDVDVELAKEQNEPFWKRKYLDIIFLVMGIVFYILYLFSVSNYSLPTTSVAANTFQSFIVVPTPILLMLGSIMFSARIYPYIVSRISSFIWDHNANLMSYSLKNVVRRKHSIIRATIILAINLAFVISFLTFPFSYEANIEQSVLYTIGSDIYVPVTGSAYSNVSYFEEKLFNVSQSLVNISDQIQYTPIITATLNGYNILVINTSTFLNAAYMRNDFAPDLVNEIHRLDLTNKSVLMYGPNFATLNLSIGQDFVWPESTVARNITATDNLFFNLTPQGVFNYWPHLLLNIPQNPANSFFAIMGFNTYENLGLAMEKHSQLFNQSCFLLPGAICSNIAPDIGLRANFLGLYIKLMNNANESAIINTLIHNITGGVNNLEVSQTVLNNVLYRNVIYQYLLGAVNNDIIYCIVIAALVIVMFSVLQIIERGKEIAIERAVGMIFKQHCLLIIYDTGWLLIFSFLSGAILGIVFASLFLLPVTIYGQIPPLITIYPFNLIIETIILIISLPSLINIIPTLLTSRIEITRLLKVE